MSFVEVSPGVHVGKSLLGPPKGKYVVQLFKVSEYDEMDYEDRDELTDDQRKEAEENIFFELCVVREGVHGHKNSWGWYGDEKICLLHTGVGGGKYSKETLDRVTKYAEMLCKELNGEEA